MRANLGQFSDADRLDGLIEAVAARADRVAFAALFEHFAPRVKAMMRRAGVSEAAADDLAQDTMLKVWRKASQFDPAYGGAAAWIFTIARNVRIDARRREQRGTAYEIQDIDAEFLVDDTPGPDAHTAAAQIGRRARAAIDGLAPEQRRILEMSIYEDRAHADIALRLQIPLGTVKSRLRLAMARLRGLLEEFS